MSCNSLLQNQPELTSLMLHGRRCAISVAVMTDPLVSCAWLSERLDAPDIRVVDATWFMPSDPRDAKAIYAERRIPGAAFFDIDEIADTSSDLPHMLPLPEKFAARMRQRGIGDGTRVIVYDNHGVFSAPRVWWTFRVMGHEDVSVLDGGFPAWETGNYTIETGAPSPRMERHFTPQMRMDLVRDLADMRRATREKTPQILDARPKDRFFGAAPEPRPGLKCGHMPGALNTPFGALIAPSGYMRPKDELERAFADMNVALDRPSVCTCGSGITAAIVALALARVGRWDAALYDGSWAEWGACADTPVETGAS
jgi:thiosulfate/3-mercaptopyruvate sulfurtransferase